MSKMSQEHLKQQERLAEHAPELLEACKKLIKAVEQNITLDEEDYVFTALTYLEDAIVKAEGE